MDGCVAIYRQHHQSGVVVQTRECSLDFSILVRLERKLLDGWDRQELLEEVYLGASLLKMPKSRGCSQERGVGCTQHGLSCQVLELLLDLGSLSELVRVEGSGSEFEAFEK